MLGSNIIRELIQQGYQPHCLVYPGRNTGTLDGLPLTSVSSNLLETSTIEAALADCDAVIHVAASTTVWPSRNPPVREINLEGTRSLVSAAKKSRHSAFCAHRFRQFICRRHRY